MKPVFSWRDAIKVSELSSTTRLVLFNLSFHMNDEGQNCYPTIAQQVQATGLSNRAVCEHLEKACTAGFLVKKQHGFAGQKWKNNEYIAAFPKEYILAVMAPDFQQEKGSDFHAEEDERQLLSRNKVVTDGHTNSTYNSTVDINKKTKTKKSTKITLAQWEEKNGAMLCVEMLIGWCRENDLDPAQLKKAIPAFRESMQSGGNLYADFVATFKVWLRKGYLPIKIEQTKRKTTAHADGTVIIDRGLSL